MKRCIVFVTMLVLNVATSVAFVDYKLRGTVRHYPTAAIADAELGYNVRVWGEPKTINYGFIRPNASASTIGAYHLATASIDVYPISFFKFRYGVAREKMNTMVSTVDCRLYDCQGRIDHQFFETKLGLGYHSWVALLRYYETFATHHDGTKPFFDFKSVTPMQAHHDHYRLFEYNLGYKWTPEWMTAFAARMGASEYQHGFGTYEYLVAIWNRKEWEIGGGPGAFRSSVVEWHFSSVLWLTWTGEKALGLI